MHFCKQVQETKLTDSSLSVVSLLSAAFLVFPPAAEDALPFFIGPDVGCTQDMRYIIASLSTQGTWGKIVFIKLEFPCRRYLAGACLTLFRWARRFRRCFSSFSRWLLASSANHSFVSAPSGCCTLFSAGELHFVSALLNLEPMKTHKRRISLTGASQRQRATASFLTTVFHTLSSFSLSRSARKGLTAFSPMTFMAVPSASNAASRTSGAESFTC